MKKMIAITIVALTLIATVLAACADKEPVGPGAVTALATTSADERGPVWSPDGRKILFKSEKWICVCDPDGSNREKLTKFEEPFVFSPDMKRVFYMKTISGKGKVICQAYMMDIDGKNQQKIAELTLEEKYVDDGGYIGSTRGPMYGIQIRSSWAWSPDRTKIFFTRLEETGYTWVWREEEGKWVRYEAGTEPSTPVLQEKGWGEVRLIAKEHENSAWIWDLKDNELRFVGHLSYGIVHYLPTGEVVWSPDSKKIMYLRVPPEYWWMPSSLDHDEGYDVWVVDIDGSNEKQLTDIPKNWEAGGWSPDGSKIVYTSWKKSSMGVGETQKIGIWMMNEDGSDKKLLTKVDTGFIEHIEWSPDGSKTALVTWILRKDKVDRDIYMIDVPDS